MGEEYPMPDAGVPPGLTHEENAEVGRVLKEYAEARRQLEKAHQMQLAAGDRARAAQDRLEEFGKTLLFRSVGAKEKERG